MQRPRDKGELDREGIKRSKKLGYSLGNRGSEEILDQRNKQEADDLTMKAA